MFALGVFAHAQTRQKAGLWEATTTMSFNGQQMPQAPQLPPGTQLPPGVHMPPGMGGPHTTQVCVTQEMVDKYGGGYSAPPRGDCTMTSHSLTATGMKATISCTGNFTGTGDVETTFLSPDSAETKMHMSGTSQGQNGQSRPVNMDMDIKSVYKGPDCGSVKPVQMPAEKQ
jgi:hypothetical protein